MEIRFCSSAVNFNGHKSIITRDYTIAANAENYPTRLGSLKQVKNLKKFGLFTLLKTKCLEEKILF